MTSAQVVTVLVAIAGSTSLTTLISAWFNIRKANKEDVSNVYRELNACRGECAEIKLQANDWRLRFNRLEDEAKQEIARWRRTAEKWEHEAERRAEEAEHWRERWMQENGR